MTEPYRARIRFGCDPTAVFLDDTHDHKAPFAPRSIARTRIGRLLGGSGLDWAPPRLPDAPVKE